MDIWLRRGGLSLNDLNTLELSNKNYSEIIWLITILNVETIGFCEVGERERMVSTMQDTSRQSKKLQEKERESGPG